MVDLQDLTTRDLLASLASCVCPACACRKHPRQTLCPACYFRLTEPVRRRLHLRIEQAYRQAVVEALTDLGQTSLYQPDDVGRRSSL